MQYYCYSNYTDKTLIDYFLLYNFYTLKYRVILSFVIPVKHVIYITTVLMRSITR